MSDTSVIENVSAKPYSLTVPAASQYVGISVSVLKQAIANGEIEVHYYAGNRPTLVLRKSLEEWVDSQPIERTNQ